VFGAPALPLPPLLRGSTQARTVRILRQTQEPIAVIAPTAAPIVDADKAE